MGIYRVKIKKLTVSGILRNHFLQDGMLFLFSDLQHFLRNKQIHQ